MTNSGREWKAGTSLDTTRNFNHAKSYKMDKVEEIRKLQEEDGRLTDEYTKHMQKVYDITNDRRQVRQKLMSLKRDEFEKLVGQYIRISRKEPDGKEYLMFVESVNVDSVYGMSLFGPSCEYNKTYFECILNKDCVSVDNVDFDGISVLSKIEFLDFIRVGMDRTIWAFEDMSGADVEKDNNE